MTERTSRTVANALLGAAAALAGYFVFRNPAWRRSALRLIRVGLTSAIPGDLIEEVSAAWKETGRRAA